MCVCACAVRLLWCYGRWGGVAVAGKCGVRNPQTASWSTPSMVVSPANRPGGRGDRRGYSRPARRDVPTAGVWCVPGWPVTTPPWYVTGNARIDVGRSDRPGSIFDLEIREPRRGSEPAGRQSACGANAGEWFPRRRRRDRRRDHTALVLLGGAGGEHCGLPALTTTTPHALSAP